MKSTSVNENMTKLWRRRVIGRFCRSHITVTIANNALRICLWTAPPAAVAHAANKQVAVTAQAGVTKAVEPQRKTCDPAVQKWTKSRVKKWLEKNALSDLQPRYIVCDVTVYRGGGQKSKQLILSEYVTTKQIISVTNEMNLCGRLPGRKFPSSWPPMLIQMYIILYKHSDIKQSNQINLTSRSSFTKIQNTKKWTNTNLSS